MPPPGSASGATGEAIVPPAAVVAAAAMLWSTAPAARRNVMLRSVVLSALLECTGHGGRFPSPGGKPHRPTGPPPPGARRRTKKSSAASISQCSVQRCAIRKHGKMPSNDPRSLPDYENRHLAKKAIAPKAPGNRPGQDDPIGSGGHKRWTRGPNETAPVCFTSRGSWVGTIHRVSGARGPARRLRCSGRARRRLARRRRQRGQARRPRCAVQDGRSPRGFGRQRACRRGRPRRQAGVRAVPGSDEINNRRARNVDFGVDTLTTRSRSRRASPRSPLGSRSIAG